VTWDDLVSVGAIVRPQGNRGEVVVVPMTDFPQDRFQPGATLWVERAGHVEAVVVRSSRPHDARWVIGLEGVGSIDEAEAFRGRELRIPPEQLQPLDAGTHYVHDLAGCVVETAEGRQVGTVKDVRLDAGIPLLVVEGMNGEVLIPFIDAICRKVDVAGKTIVVEPPEGLLELNEKVRRVDL
jgi:16S rRNA processing protein RimM